MILQEKKAYNPVEIINRYFCKFGLRFQGEGVIDTRPLLPAFKLGIGKRILNGVRPMDLEIYLVSCVHFKRPGICYKRAWPRWQVHTCEQ